MRHIIFAAAALLAASPARAQSAAPNRDPEKARLVTSDIARFWRVYDAATLGDAAERFQRDYVDAGSDGVKGFVPGRILSGRHLAGTVASRPRYYRSVRAATMAVDTSRALHDSIRASFRRLQALLPEAVFPDVYFVIGRINSGGTPGRAGLLIGTEMYGRSADTPLDELTDWEKSVVQPATLLPHLVAHELAHYQQSGEQGPQTLLQKAIREGGADFVAELISGRNSNPVQHAWAAGKERALWAEFQPAMLGTDVSGWMYQGDKAKGRPADLGYWMGYQIARAYHERAPDKRAALRRILAVEDVEGLLRESGWGERMGGVAGR